MFDNCNAYKVTNHSITWFIDWEVELTKLAVLGILSIIGFKYTMAVVLF
jgi:hypothetical protein